MFQNLLKKVDDIVTFLVLTVLFVFPIVRLVAAVFFGGIVLIPFEVIMTIYATGYLAWFVYAEIYPMLAMFRTPENIIPKYNRWLTLFFVIPWVVPYFRVDTSTVSENAVMTSAIVCGLTYMVVAYRFGPVWFKGYFATLLEYTLNIKNFAQPLVLDILNNNNKKAAPAKAAVKSTKGQNEINFAPPPAEKRVDVPKQPVQLKPVPPIQQPVVLPNAVFAAATTADPAPTVEDLLGETGDAKAVDEFVRLLKDRESVINKSAYALKSGEFTNFGIFNALVRTDKQKAFGIYMGWLDESRGAEYRAEARKALGLS